MGKHKLRKNRPKQVFSDALEPIPGSRFFRAYCIECYAPIRVAEHYGGGFCEWCSGGSGNVAKSAAPYNADIDWGGYSDQPLNE